MFSEAKVTEIYCLADDFCKEFAKYQEKHMFSTSSKDGKHRNKPNRMSDAEIMLIMILFHSGGYRCFKHFYLEYVCKHLAHLFPAECHTTVLWNWKRKSSFLWSYSSRQCCWEHVPVSVLWIPHHYVSAETKEYISTKLLKDWLHVENVQWGGSSDSNCI